ncbi:MAG: hypothetical protein AB8B99_04825 [Phormidesmis sp.]
MSSLSERLKAIHSELSTLHSTAAPQLQQQLLQCQSLFQKIVAQLAASDLTPEIEQRVRPAQTEAHRLLRLMGVDGLRLAAAKRPETLAKLRAQLLTQTESLQGFVQVIFDVL